MSTSIDAGRTVFRAVLLVLLFLASVAHATDFVLEDMQGKPQRLADYRGKWVLVNFWATWCPPCLREIPELNSLHQAHKDTNLVVIGIVMDSGSSSKVADFVRAHDMKYPIVMGDRKVSRQIGRIDVLPTSYLFSPEGEQVTSHAGSVTRESIEAYIKSSRAK